MNDDTNAVTVIIPTLASSARAGTLFRAIRSVERQVSCSIALIVVINGNEYDDEVCAKLEELRKIRMIFQKKADLPGALYVGRMNVKTEFFAFLDDDDVYMDCAMVVRLEEMRRDPSIDIVVTNGVREREGKRSSVWIKTMDFAAEPLIALLHENWLASCGGLFRTSRVPAEYFKDLVKYYEWTHLAFHCTLFKVVKFVDVATFEIGDSLESLSKSEDYLMNGEKLYMRILELPLPKVIRYQLKRKYGTSLHVLAEHFRKKGCIKNAWYLHVRSLAQPSGWRYLAYTRKLLAG